MWLQAIAYCHAGTPEEEKALCEHIQSLCPTNAQSEEVGQLLEVLILLGHDRDARILQKAFDNLVKIQKVCLDPQSRKVAKCLFPANKLKICFVNKISEWSRVLGT